MALLKSMNSRFPSRPATAAFGIALQADCTAADTAGLGGPLCGRSTKSTMLSSTTLAVTAHALHRRSAVSSRAAARRPEPPACARTRTTRKGCSSTSACASRRRHSLIPTACWWCGRWSWWCVCVWPESREEIPKRQIEQVRFLQQYSRTIAMRVHCVAILQYIYATCISRLLLRAARCSLAAAALRWAAAPAAGLLRFFCYVQAAGTSEPTTTPDCSSCCVLCALISPPPAACRPASPKREHTPESSGRDKDLGALLQDRYR